MTLQNIMDRLVAEGYENCRFYGTQIIVNDRGEIELAYGEARLYDRFTPGPDYTYGNHQAHANLDALMDDVKTTWPLKEST